MMKNDKLNEAGFTLVELLTAMAITAILATQAVPSFFSTIQNNRLTTQANEFVFAMNFARGEAIKRGAAITIVATGNASDNEWGDGWNVMSGGEVLKQFSALDGSSVLNSAGNINTFTYASSGRINTADVLSLCDGRSGETGRIISISTTGRVSTTDLPCT